MKRVRVKTKVKAKAKDIIKSFDVDFFLKLSPPFLDVEVNQFDGYKTEDSIKITTNFLGYYQFWHNQVIDYFETDKEVSFIEQAIETPFPVTSWQHKHKIIQIDDEHCYIIDDVEYSCINFFFENMIYPAVFLTMYYRRPVYVDKFHFKSDQL